VTEVDGSIGRWPDIRKLYKCGVGVSVDTNGDSLLHHSWTTGGAASTSTGTIAERRDSFGCGVGGGSCGGGGDDAISTGRSGAVEFDGGGADPPHHSGATKGAASLKTGAATHASARGCGLVRHWAVCGGGGYSVEVSNGRPGDGAGPQHHSGATGGAAGFRAGATTHALARGGGFIRHGGC